MSIAEKLQTIAENEQKVYDAGKKSEYDAFWDIFQQNGNRTNYSHGFAGLGWNDETFKPKYDINIIEGERVFTNTRITDLKGILERHNVKLDTSQSYYFSQPFMNSTITDSPVLDMRSHVNISYLLHNAKSLVNVDKVIIKNDGSQTLNYFATGCTALKEIRFEGVIGNNIDFKDSPLTKESITSIINALSPTVSGKTVTFSNTAVTNAFGS
ncbi:MAG: hypothetical protein J6D52_02820, partial [Clostridia bacterium]|nr:hypothetical protein [Clostridia bacterium]